MGFSEYEGRCVVFPPKQQEKEKRGLTNPASEGVIDVEARNGADTSPCGHGHHEEEKEPRAWRRKGEEGCEGVYRAYTVPDVRRDEMTSRHA